MIGGASWKDKKVLVAGGCGFLGSYVVEQVVAAGAEVTVVDSLDPGTLENIEGVADVVRFSRRDLSELSSCLEVVAGQEIVLNLAGKVHGVGYSSEHHAEMLFKNAILQLNIFEACRRQGVSRYLLVSSSCVYPDDAPDPVPELPPTVGLPEAANQGYGWAKRIAEIQAGFGAASGEGPDVAVCRPVNAYGGRYLWRGEDGSQAVPSLVKKVMDGDDPVVVWGSGKQRRNYLHARDVATLMLLVTERYATGKPVNIGSESDISVMEIIDVISEVTGKKPKVAFDLSKPEGRMRKRVDSTLLRQLTPEFVPTVGFPEGIAEMVEWYKRVFAT